MYQSELISELLNLLPHCSEKKQQEIIRQLEEAKAKKQNAKNERVPIPFAEFATRTMASPLHPWQEVLCTILERMRYEKGLRILLHAPPQVGKSILVSQRLPAYLIGENPNIRVGLACYNETHSTNFGAVIRDICASPEYAQMYPASVVSKSESAKEFSTGPRAAVRDAQPSFKAMGLLSGFVGRGVDSLIIDDPYKSAADAQSAAVNGAVKRWWSQTCRPRINDSTNVLVMFHRYHNDDIGAELLREGGWEFYRFPGIADEEEGQGIDPTMGVCRVVGEALSPLKSLGEYEREKIADPATYASQVKGIPMTETGSMFKVSAMVEIYQRPPVTEIANECRAWDIAATEGAGDYTAGVNIAKLKDGKFALLDAEILQGSPDQVDTAIVDTATADGKRVTIHFAQDPGSAGKRDAQALTRKLPGYTRKVDTASGSKENRARAFASEVNLGNFVFLDNPAKTVKTGPYAGMSTMRALIAMLRAFPTGTAKKDGVDAAADAYNELAKPPQQWGVF
jgi:predicted phage terminase large subunit-like protein